MDAQGRARLTEILNQHDAAARALRDSSDAFDQLMVDMRSVVTMTHAANEAQRVAIDALLAANRAALALLNDEGGR
jgi:hypothetical protein